MGSGYRELAAVSFNPCRASEDRSLDTSTSLVQVAGLAVPFLADRCSIDLVAGVWSAAGSRSAPSSADLFVKQMDEPFCVIRSPSRTARSTMEIPDRERGEFSIDSAPTRGLA
jgi:hypothetical protein